ncbi:unnamed protein product [Linum trigynum]|uniref:Uncharacterized protein n=1 Tax=Linum trigynum TaxID=586398 RepID=A0AAV2DVW7_9ROSI
MSNESFTDARRISKRRKKGDKYGYKLTYMDAGDKLTYWKRGLGCSIATKKGRVCNCDGRQALELACDRFWSYGGMRRRRLILRWKAGLPRGGNGGLLLESGWLLERIRVAGEWIGSQPDSHPSFFFESEIPKLRRFD